MSSGNSIDPKAFSKRLKEERIAARYSQEELALKVNIAPSTISAYEKGKRSPNLSKAQTLADFFNVSLEYLTGKSDTKELITQKQLDEISNKTNNCANENEFLKFTINIKKESLSEMITILKDEIAFYGSRPKTEKEEKVVSFILDNKNIIDLNEMLIDKNEEQIKRLIKIASVL